MTVSHTNHKSTQPKSHHAAAADATHASSHTEVAAAEASTATSPVPTSSISAKEAIAQLDALEAKLNLNIVIPPNDKNQNRSLNRVSDTAIGLASDIVSADPARFADFAGLPASASYVSTMNALALRAAEFATHVQNGVQNERSPAAAQTLVLYSVAKNLGRITTNETMREKVELLRTEVAPKRKNPKPKKTKAEKAAERLAKSKANRVAKAQQVLAANGVILAPPSPQPAASTPPPSPSPSAATPAPELATPPSSAPPASH